MIKSEARKNCLVWIRPLALMGSGTLKWNKSKGQNSFIHDENIAVTLLVIRYSVVIVPSKDKYIIIHLSNMRWPESVENYTAHHTETVIMRSYCMSKKKWPIFFIVTYYIEWVTTSWTDGIWRFTLHLEVVVKHELTFLIWMI